MESSKNSATDISVSQTTPTTSKSHIFSVRTTRSDVKSSKPASRTGIFQSVYLFCDQGRKKVKGVEQHLINVETKDYCETCIKKYVNWMDDGKLLAKVSDIDLIAKEAKYRKCCCVKYQMQAEAKIKEGKKQTGEYQTEGNYCHLQHETHLNLSLITLMR